MNFAEYKRELPRLQEQGDFMDGSIYAQAIELGEHVGVEEILRQRDRYYDACVAFGTWQELGRPDEDMPEDARLALDTMREFWP